jgi:hypothetical protein
MLLKSRVIETVETFGEEMELDELLEKLVVLNKISIAEEQIKNGQIFSEEEADLKMDKWFA